MAKTTQDWPRLRPEDGVQAAPKRSRAKTKVAPDPEPPVPGAWKVLLPELLGATLVFVALTLLLALFGPDRGRLLLKIKWALVAGVGRHGVFAALLSLGTGVFLLSRRHRGLYGRIALGLLAWVVLLPPLDHLIATTWNGQDVLKETAWNFSAGGAWGQWVTQKLVSALGAWTGLISYVFFLLVLAWFKTGLSFKALLEGIETAVAWTAARLAQVGQWLQPLMGDGAKRMQGAGKAVQETLLAKSQREAARGQLGPVAETTAAKAPPADGVEEETSPDQPPLAEEPPITRRNRLLARFAKEKDETPEGETPEEDEVILHQEIASLEDVDKEDMATEDEDGEEVFDGEDEEIGDEEEDFEVETVGLCASPKGPDKIQERRHDDITYLLPPTFLLNEPEEDNSDFDHGEAERLRQTLDDFKVQAKITKVLRGPNVTRYELTLPRGVKVKKIVELQDEIAMSLAAQSVRIQAPIPGKNAIGVELPRKDPVVVRLRELLDSDAFKTAKSKLTIAVGKEVTGQPIVANLASMPHLLIAGATGQGKSGCLNVLITSLVLKATPFEVKLILIDPKRVEFPIYSRLPHLLCPVVEDSRQAINALQWVADEMTRRYDLLKQHNKRNLDDYNNTVPKYDHEKLPRIVVIVDELNDLLMTSLKRGNVEELICRIAQLARAAGIHLVLATQRPDVKVITGTIKANIPCRIAFATTSQIDSRTIIDLGGAEKLLGRGDMLFLNGGRNIQRLQGAFLDEAEIEKVVNFCAEQIAPMYNEEILTFGQDDDDDESVSQYLDGVDDDRFEDALKLVLSMQTASTSYLQRKLGIGYNRAARLIDLMEEKGIVDSADPSKPSAPRKVLVAQSA